MENAYYIISKILYLASYGLTTILIILIPIGLYALYRLIIPKQLEIVVCDPTRKENIKKIKEKDLNYDKIIELITHSSKDKRESEKEIFDNLNIKSEEIHAFCETCENLQCEIKKENENKKEKCVLIVKKLLEDKQKVKMMYEEFSNIKENFLMHKKESSKDA